ncbi:hypothetical protein DCC85_10255 [Paenibacillus sp. CAA11]|uniref:response regulator n=1 Tax=Paenibacillus sp. CAA11 TaxID=1532905 RepID=UPI000D3652C1|nr:response regulator [Paenibacillus sp. CAA11]AWB44570.1 hypothetical protein DCC85_10255 [Paenibacillus sp. CAA11]
MIKAILIDDEILALKQLSKLLNKVSEFEIVGSYTEPLPAIEAAGVLKPDIIFLDIVMPEMNGMQTAEFIQQVSPSSHIVFVTGYDRYAIDAFEMNALDYVLKPVQMNRLTKTVNRITDRLLSSDEQQTGALEKKICCFQSLRPEMVHRSHGHHERTLPFRWRTTKAQELFAYLLHHRNRFVNKDTLIQEFWPDHEFKKASTYLYTTIYHIRQCLKQADLEITISNVSGGEGYMLNTNQVQVDVDMLEGGIRALGAVTKLNITDHRQISDLYTGDYLAEHDYFWAESERHRLRTVWLHHAAMLADFYSNHDMLAEAITMYKRITQFHPYYEDGHLGLLQAYASAGDRMAVQEHYQHIEQMYSAELEIPLPEFILQWYYKWNSSQDAGMLTEFRA